MNNNPKREEKYVWGCDESMCAGVNDKEASNETVIVLQQSSSKVMRVFGG